MTSSSAHSRARPVALTFLSGQARELGKQAVNLFAWPVVVNGLGMTAYGIWVLVLQVAGYVQLSDLRVSSVLGLLLARERRSDDDARKRRLIGAHLLISSVIALLIAVVGAGVVFAAPYLFKLHGDDIVLFRLAMGFAVVGVMAAPFLAIPNMAFYSQNQAYRSFIYVFGFDLIAPVLSALVVLAGFGVIGLSLATLLVAVLTAFVLFRVARRHFAWMGVARPRREEVRQMLGNGVRYQIDGLAWMLSENSAGILLAWLCGMKEVAIYAVTERLLRVSQIVANRLCNAAAPVVGEFAGAADRTSLRQAWSLLSGVNNAIAAGSFLVLMPLNTLFLDVLLGPGKHGGALLSTLLAAKVLMISRSSPPAYFMNQMLLLRAKNRWSLIWVIALATCSAVLVPAYGMAGMAGAMLLSSLLMQQGYTWQVYRALDYNVRDFLRQEVLPLLCVLTVGALLAVATPRLSLHGLPAGLVSALVLGLAAAAFVWWIVLRGEQRGFLQGMVRRHLHLRGVVS